MTNETTAYRSVLEDLARSRGLEGAQELARKVHEAAPDFPVRELLESPPGGFGEALGLVLDTNDAEKARIVSAFCATFLSSRRDDPIVCGGRGCERPAAPEHSPCEEHLAEFNARAEEEAWDLAISILRPWVEAAGPIGSPELTAVMERALKDAEGRLGDALDRLERAQAAL